MLDLKHGFHQMPLHPHDRHSAPIPTLLGTLCWRVLPMGVKDAPAQFKKCAPWSASSTTDLGRLWTGIHDPLSQPSIYIDDPIIGSVDAKTQIFRLSDRFLTAFKLGKWCVD